MSDGGAKLGPIVEDEAECLFALLEGRGPVALAVSGGPDSMALMHLAWRWRAAAPAQRPALAVLTVDHGLRPESASEAAWVRQCAEDLGLEAAILRWTGEKPATGVQMAAREARYDLLTAHARRRGLSAIVTAHHLDDQAETVIMRLARGSGVDGLAAMTAESNWAGVPILRPLLAVRKARLVATLERDGVAWLEDPGNASDRFERVRVRRVVAELERLGIAPEALALTAKRMGRARAALDAITEASVSAHAAIDPARGARMPLPALLDLPEEVSVRVLSRLLGAVAARTEPPRPGRLEALLEALRRPDFRGRTLGGCRIRVREGEIRIEREGARRPRAARARTMSSRSGPAVAASTSP